MRRGHRRHGATLPELVALLGLLAILLGMAVPTFATARDAWAARTARDHAAALVSRTRALATLHGSARIRIDTAGGTLGIEAPIGMPLGASEPLGARYGVRISAGATELDLDFDALGMGRLANRTLRFTRGRVETRLTLSTYGRPKRW